MGIRLQLLLAQVPNLGDGSALREARELLGGGLQVIFQEVWAEDVWILASKDQAYVESNVTEKETLLRGDGAVSLEEERHHLVLFGKLFAGQVDPVFGYREVLGFAALPPGDDPVAQAEAQ